MAAGKRSFKPYKPKPRPKPKIDYPPVPTKKWIPPDKRKKPPKPGPKYVKPEGMTQKLAISSLKKVWNQYEVVGDAAILTGNFSQFHKRFTFKTNGLQGACNAAIACVYSQLYKMETWGKGHLDNILLIGDEVYVKSTQQGDRCLIEIPPEKVYTSFYLGNKKISLYISEHTRVTEKLVSASPQKAKEIIEGLLEGFLNKNGSGIVFIEDKYAALWENNGTYYYFDPGEHDELGEPWRGAPGGGFALLARFKQMDKLVDCLYKNMGVANAKVQAIACGISRIITIDTTPPDTFESIQPREEGAPTKFEDEEAAPLPPPNPKIESLREYVEDGKKPIEPQVISVQEISPEVTEDLSPSKRPSWLQEGPINKADFCRYPIPVPTFLKTAANLTYYTDLDSSRKMAILRGNTCQTNPSFSKYGGRQAMGNAISTMIMLRLCKAKFWIPRTVDRILERGDILYRDAMLTIPRTHTLRLSDFSGRVEYSGRYYIPEIDECAAVGQMQSQDFEILDLEPALDDFLNDNDCCVVLGPLVLPFWCEDGEYYMFDPNERDQNGKAQTRVPYTGSIGALDIPSGVACVIRSKCLRDLVDLYVQNTEKSRRSERFYLSRVQIKDYVDLPDDWNDFKAVALGKWILRGTFSQYSHRFPPESRGTQGSASAIIGLALRLLLPVQEWSSDTVDDILMVGNDFYLESMNLLQSKNLFKQPMLMLSELKQSHPLRGKEAEFEILECVVNGMVYAKDTNDLPNLQKGLETFFHDNDAGVIAIREISLAVWKSNGDYFYLDPYSRDDKGIATGYGTSCVLKFVTLEDLAKSVEFNLDPKTEDLFNINTIKVNFYEMGDAGVVRPPLNKYTKLDDNSAILRSWLSEKSDKYEIRRGRQSVPMCLSAVAFNKLKPSLEWTKNDMDTILDRGDMLYVRSMATEQKADETPKSTVVDKPAEEAPGGGDSKPSQEPQKPPPAKESGDAEETDANNEGSPREELEEEEEEPETEIVITPDNVCKEFDIGPNKILINFDDVAEANIKEALKDSLRSFFGQEQTDDNFNQEALLETKHYIAAMWRDDKVYYVFDSKPRDKNGETIGKQDWDPESEEPEPQPEPAPDQEGEEDAPEEAAEEEGGETEGEPEGGELEGEMEDEEGLAEEELVEEEEEKQIPLQKPRPKKSPSFWLEQEKTGRACVLWFVYLDDLVNYVYNNICTKDRLKKDFKLMSIGVVNKLNVKNKYNPEDERIDVYAGDWYCFKETDYGRWILRGTIDLTNELFPIGNRGRQTLTASVIALATANIFEMTCFVRTTPDSIMTYGDKLYTFMKRNRKKQLLEGAKPNLKEEEIDWLIRHEEFHVSDIPKRICIKQFMVNVQIEPEAVSGDVKAQDFEEIYDVKRGLDHFFEENVYGILSAKGVNVAVWRGQHMFYMFDGLKRGPNGVQSNAGTACVTRYLDISKLAEVFVANLPLQGKNQFAIHKVTLMRDLCPREKEPVVKIPAPKTVSTAPGLKPILPGKCIIRGTMSQEDSRFGKGPNIMSAPIAVVALTMSLIHKAETWARPIVDEILILGAELYEDSVNELGFDFNPWDDMLDIYKVKNDYKLGVAKANCEFRNTDQTGVIDGKESGVKNLRQGVEDFFEENTHGILVTEPLTLALWEEQQEDDTVIYMFDPNPRNAMGMPLFMGTACVVSFVNAKLASDHIIGCIMNPAQRLGHFTIVPVEIVVGNVRTKYKMERSPTRSSVNVLPRCSKLVATEQMKLLRKLAEEQRKRKEAKRLQMIGRNGYHLMKGGEAILRGYRSQNCDVYCSETRNQQDIPNCIVSVVLHTLLPIEDWSYKHIDLVLDTGDQLYVDSYIAYSPRDAKLGMENVVRKFYMDSLEVHVTVYKPIITDVFLPSRLNPILEAYFQQEQFCILNYKDQWVSLFMKGGFFYMFDPHERDIEGNPIKEGQRGTAVVVRFDTLNDMTLKVVNNLACMSEDAEETSTFSLWLISVETKSDT